MLEQMQACCSMLATYNMSMYCGVCPLEFALGLATNTFSLTYSPLTSQNISPDFSANEPTF